MVGEKTTITKSGLIVNPETGRVAQGVYKGEPVTTCDTFTHQIPGVILQPEEAKKIRRHLNLADSQFHLDMEAPMKGTYCIMHGNPVKSTHVLNNVDRADVGESWFEDHFVPWKDRTEGLRDSVRAESFKKDTTLAWVLGAIASGIGLILVFQAPGRITGDAIVKWFNAGRPIIPLLTGAGLYIKGAAGTVVATTAAGTTAAVASAAVLGIGLGAGIHYSGAGKYLGTDWLGEHLADGAIFLGDGAYKLFGIEDGEDIPRVTSREAMREGGKVYVTKKKAGRKTIPVPIQGTPIASK